MNPLQLSIQNQKFIAQTFEFVVLHFVRCDTVTVSPNQIIIIIINSNQVELKRTNCNNNKKCKGDRSYQSLRLPSRKFQSNADALGSSFSQQWFWCEIHDISNFCMM